MKHFSKDQLLKVLSRILFVLLVICSLALISVVQADDDVKLYFTLTEVKGQIDDGKNTMKSARCLIVFSDPAKVGYKNAFCRYDNDKRDSDDGNIIAKLNTGGIGLPPYKADKFEVTIERWFIITRLGKKEGEGVKIEGEMWNKFLISLTKENERDTLNSPFRVVAKVNGGNIPEQKITLSYYKQEKGNIPDLNGLPNTVSDEIFAFLAHQSIVDYFREKTTAVQAEQGNTKLKTETVDNTGNSSKVINDEVRTEMQKVSGEVQTGLKNILEELQKIDRGEIFSLPADHFLAVLLVVITMLIFAIVIIFLWKLKRAVVELSQHIDDKSGEVTGEITKKISLEKLQKLLEGLPEKFENTFKQKFGEVTKGIPSETKLTQQLNSIESSLGSIGTSIEVVKDLKWWEDNLATIKNGLEITELSRLNQQLNEINRTNKQLQGDLKEKGETLTAVTKERDGLEDALKTVNDKLSQTVENLQKEQTRFEEQRKQLADSNSQKDDLQTKLENEQQSHLLTKTSHDEEMQNFKKKVESLLRERFCLSKPEGMGLVDWMEQLQRQTGTWQWLQVMLAITLSRCEGMVKELKTLSIKDKSPAFSKLGKVIEVIEPEKLLTIGRALTAGAFVSDEELRAKLLKIDNGEWLQRFLRAEAVSSTYFSKDEYQTLKPLFEEISTISGQLETVLRRLGVEFYKPQLLGPKFDFDTQVKMVTETSFSFSKAFKELVKPQFKQPKADPAVGGEEIIVWVSKYGIKENQNSEPVEVRVVRYNSADWR
jgi:uncharacterized protein YoxC